MLTYTKIYNVIDYYQKEKINNLIQNKVITENQFCRMLSNVFNLSDNSSNVEIQSKIYQTLFPLELIGVILKKKGDYDQHNKVIKRLMDKRLGEETLNELYCHSILHNSFKNYIIRPLFLDDPDGIILDENHNIEIPISIKSRLLESLLLLEKLFSEISGIIPDTSGMTLLIKMEIIKVSNFNKQTLLKVVGDVERFLIFKLNNILVEFDDNEQFSYPEISFSIYLGLKKQVNIPAVNIEMSKNRIHCDYRMMSMEPGYLPLLLFQGDLSQTLSDEISKNLFNGLLNHQNSPKEPRIFAFFSKQCAGDIFNDYLNNLFQNYTNQNKGTLLVGIVLEISNQRDKNGVFIRYFSAGEKIKKDILKYSKELILPLF